MSLCKIFGKDKLIFVTKEDHEKPCSIVVPELDTRFEEHGLVTPSGELNWSCPCVGNMTAGPCGSHFKEAFGCFHVSKAEPKGSDCMEAFLEMQKCFMKYPGLYQMGDKDESALNEINNNLTGSKKD